MLVESVSILAILLCIVIIFVRSGHRVAALSTVPLLLVPAVHLLAFGLSWALAPALPGVPREVMIAFADIAAVALAGVVVHLQSVKLHSKKVRRVYATLICGYNIILTCVYVYNTLSPILHH